MSLSTEKEVQLNKTGNAWVSTAKKKAQQSNIVIGVNTTEMTTEVKN